MAKRTRPLMMTGVALASATAIVTASPALLPTHDITVSAAPSPLKLSTAKYELTALSDITLQGINDAYWFGWGGYVGCGDADAQGFCTFTPQDPYYPGVNSVYVTGAAGVAYYLTDNIIDQFVPGFDLDNYYFEIGSSRGGGLPAVLYVASGEVFGTSSPIFSIAQSVFYYGVPNVINSLIVSVSSALPQLNIGPVTVGGGILASLYFTGSTPDGSFNYGSGGLSSVLSYVVTSISDSLAPPAANTAAALKSAAATTQSATGTETTGSTSSGTTPSTTEPATAKAKGDGGTTSTSSDSSTPSPGGTTTSADSTTTSPDSTTASTGTTTETKTTTVDTSSESAGSTTGGSSATGDSSASGGSSSTGEGGSTGSTASSATPKSTGGAGPKAPKPDNPLSKIGKRISDALSGKKSTDSSSGNSSSGSGSSSSGS